MLDYLAIDNVIQGIAMQVALLRHFIVTSVTLANDVSGEWFVNYSATLTDKGHSMTGALSSIIDYGTVFLAQLLAVITAGASSATGSVAYIGGGNYQTILP